MEGIVVMETPSLPLLERALNAVALGFRLLRNEIRLLIGSLPRLRDAFDADELPVTFILRRDSRRFESERARHVRAMPAMTPIRPRPAMQRVDRRSTQKKASDE
jgi:hypothetical protein